MRLCVNQDISGKTHESFQIEEPIISSQNWFLVSVSTTRKRIKENCLGFLFPSSVFRLRRQHVFIYAAVTICSSFRRTFVLSVCMCIYVYIIYTSIYIYTYTYRYNYTYTHTFIYFIVLVFRVLRVYTENGTNEKRQLPLLQTENGNDKFLFVCCKRKGNTEVCFL